MLNPLKHLALRLVHTDHAFREIFFATIFLMLWLVIGTLGYIAIEGWALMDGLYMAFITLTTIGFGEIHPLSTAGRVFTIFIATVGIGSDESDAARGAQLLLANELLRQRQNREMTFNPGPDDRMEAGDTLIVLGSQEMITRLQREGCSAQE